MRHRLLARVIAPVAVVAAALALAAPASADVLVTGGTSTFTVPAATVAELKDGGIVVKEAAGAGKIRGTDGSRGILFTVTGGDADLNQLVGTITLAGSIKVVHGGRSVKFNKLEIDLVNFQLTAVTAKHRDRFPLFDLADVSFDPSTGEFDSASAMITQDGQDVFDAALGETDLDAGLVLGSLTTTITSVVVPLPAVARTTVGHAVAL